MFFRTFLAMTVAAALAAGCSDDESNDTGSTSAGTGGSAGSGQSGSSGQSGTSGAAGQTTRPCVEEFKATGNSTTGFSLEYTPWACVMPTLCDTVTFSPVPAGSSTIPTSKELAYELAPDATRCFLEALRDGKTGKLTVSWTNAEQGDTGSTNAEDVFALGDGTVLYESRQSLGCCGLLTVYKSGRLVLKDKAYFDDCLAKAPGVERAMCVLGFSTTDSGGDKGTPPWTTGACDGKPAACP